MELTLVIIAMAAGSFIKGVTGFGLPQIAIPVMATFLGAEAAIVLMAIPGVATNAWLLVSHRSHRFETRDLPVLLVTGSLGAIAGTFLLRSLNEEALSLALAALLFGYIALFMLHPTLKLSARTTRRASPAVGTIAGVLQGSTGMSGPVVTTYIHSYRLSQQAYVFSITTLFQVFAVVQMVTMAAVGLYTAERLRFSLLSLIPIMLMLPVGTFVAKRLPHRVFDVVVLCVMGLSAVKLLFDALA